MKTSEILDVHPLLIRVHQGFPGKKRRKRVKDSFYYVTVIGLIVVLENVPKLVGFCAIKLITSLANIFYLTEHNCDEI